MIAIVGIGALVLPMILPLFNEGLPLMGSLVDKRHENKETTDGETHYTNKTYGYSFSYPSGTEARTLLPERVVLGTSTSTGFDARAEVLVTQSAPDNEYRSFDEFLIARTKEICRAYGSREVINCSDISHIEYSTNSFDFQEEVVYFETQNIGTDMFGPVYAFNVSAYEPSSSYAALLIYEPLSTLYGGLDADLKHDVARQLIIYRRR
jgi:hypothetical protein